LEGRHYDADLNYKCPLPVFTYVFIPIVMGNEYTTLVISYARHKKYPVFTLVFWRYFTKLFKNNNLEKQRP